MSKWSEVGIHVGVVDETPFDWRKQPVPFDPDDEELDETPSDVIGMLGFDPLHPDEEEKFDREAT
jgi:hypothetical protein